MVLRDETQDRSPSLEMYEKDELLTAPLGLTGPKLILDLGQCVHIGFTSDSTRFPYALVIVCQGRSPLLLAADDELSARSWLLALGLITHKGNSGNDILSVTIFFMIILSRYNLSISYCETIYELNYVHFFYYYYLLLT